MTLRAACIPNSFGVAEKCRMEIVLELDRVLTASDVIRFQFPNSWSVVSGPSFTRKFQTDSPDTEHFVHVFAQNNSSAEFAVTMQPRHLNYPEGHVRHGRLFEARLLRGEIPAASPITIRYANTFAPYIAETEQLWLRVNEEAPAAAPVLTVLPGPHERFRVIAPSSARPGELFDVRVVSLDRFDNASSTPFDGEKLLFVDGRVAADNLRFTGTLAVPIRLGETGVYRLRFRDAISNAVKVDADACGPHWGDIHIHTKLSHDGQGTDPYAYARNVSGLDFAAVADHWDSLGPEGYKILKQWTHAADENGRFVTLFADERNPPELTGHHNVYFRNMDVMERYQAIQVPGEGPADSLERLRGADASEVLIIPHHTGICFHDLVSLDDAGSAVDWDAADAGSLRPVMEIYSHHGQSECYAPHHLLAYEWNRLRNPERRANTSVPGPHYAQDYWMHGCRIGVIASSDEHSGQGGRRHGGIAGVLADALTRENIFDAIRARRCYATTGERILVEFRADDAPMGSVSQRKRGDKVRLDLKIWATSELLRVEILRYRFGMDKEFRPVVSIYPKDAMDTAVTFDDVVESPCMYYARVTQEPLDWPGMAWTSPIWIDV
jgi:hypothetical protein